MPMGNCSMKMENSRKNCWQNNEKKKWFMEQSVLAFVSLACLHQENKKILQFYP